MLARVRVLALRHALSREGLLGMIRSSLALIGLVLLSHASPTETSELDPRLTALEERISQALPNWMRDVNLAPAAFAAWDLKLDGDLVRCSLFNDLMGADPDTFIEGMAMVKPGAKLVGEPRTLQTPASIELQFMFEVPGEGYGYVWTQVLGLRGKTSLSPALFSMNTSKDEKATLEKFTEEMKVKKALLQPAFAAHLRHAFGLRVSVKDDVVTVLSGPSFPIPKGWKSSSEPMAVSSWTGDGEARLDLDAMSTLEHSADAIIAAATLKMSEIAASTSNKHDVTFVDGKNLVRLALIEQEGYLYLLRASAPVAADKAKRAAFSTAIASTFAGPIATPAKPAEKKPAKK